MIDKADLIEKEVLKLDHGEFEGGKAKRIYTKATIVHHVN